MAGQAVARRFLPISCNFLPFSFTAVYALLFSSMHNKPLPGAELSARPGNLLAGFAFIVGLAEI
jgi:hypothetical protein